MIRIVRDNLIKYNMVYKDEYILVALSGGPDSMALLDCLYKLRSDFDYKLLTAHVNHGVRGIEAKRDQQFSKEKSELYGIPFYTIDVDMINYGKEYGISSEEAGRILRYGFFREILSKVGGGKIAVAHNKNDQAETVLLRIMRGTGLDGLKAMEFVNGDVIRPILNVDREDIESYISQERIETVADHTNMQSIYSRNRVRLEMIPFIKEHFNPSIIDGLWRLSSLAKSELDIIDDVVEKKFNLLVKNTELNSIIFSGNTFNKEPEAIRKRLIRKSILVISGNLQGYEEKHIQEVVDLFYLNKTGKKKNLFHGIVARISYDELIIEETKANSASFPITMLTLGINKIETLNILIELQEVDAHVIETNDKNSVIVDMEVISGDIVVRGRAPGDVISPMGLNGSKKLKDFFIDKKIPQEERDTLPIIADKNSIIWIPGFTLNEKYKITDKTKIALRITFLRL